MAASHEHGVSESSGLLVQGIVAYRPGETPEFLAQVQYSYEGPEGKVGWQQDVDEARAHAALVLEAAANAAYETAFVEWLVDDQQVKKETAFESLTVFREFRRDRWGKPMPERWNS